VLLQRVLTAVVLVVVVLAAIFKLPAHGFGLFLLLILSAAIWEWSALAGLKSVFSRLAYLLLLLFLISLVEFLSPSIAIIMMPGLLFWSMAFYWVLRYPGGEAAWGQVPVLLLLGVALLLPAWSGFRYLRNQEFYIFHLIFLPGLVASADIGAYFSGRAFGKHKLAPMVSPNKTWEGVAGGIISCIAVTLLTAALLVSTRFALSVPDYLLFGGAALVIAAISVLGDLFESMVKRFRGVKDSGRLLPGHGGVLDRIDALTAAIPLYTLMLLQLETVSS